MTNYSAPRSTGTTETIISAIREGDCFIAENQEGIFKAKKDAYLSEDNAVWIVEAEDEDFESRMFAVRKSDIAYAPKMGIVR